MNPFVQNRDLTEQRGDVGHFLEIFNVILDAATRLHNSDELEFDSDEVFFGRCSELEDLPSVENCFLPKDFNNKKEFEEYINSKESVNDNYTFLPEGGNLDINEISPTFADSKLKGLDLIDLYLEPVAPVSPTPSSATSTSSSEIDLKLLDNLFEENCVDSRTVTNQQSLQTFIPTSAACTKSSISPTTINNKTSEAMMQRIGNYWDVVPRQNQGSTINGLITQTLLSRSQQINVVTKTDFKISDNQSVYTTQQSCPTNKIYSLDSGNYHECSTSGTDSSSSTLPSPSPLESQSSKVLAIHSTQKLQYNDSPDSMSGSNLSSLSALPSPIAIPSNEITPSTRRERNNKASKKLRMKRKRKEEELDAQEALEKKRKLDLERKVDALKIQIAEEYKNRKMMINHFAQDNLCKYKQRLSAVLHQQKTQKQDFVYDKVCKKTVNYFMHASSRYINPEQQDEIMDWLLQQQQQQQQQQQG